MVEIGDKVIAITNRDGAFKAGLIYEIEAVEHPSLGKCGLIKLRGVRDYWNEANFIKITKDMFTDPLL